MSDETTTPVEETLAWEASHRRTASAGALVAGMVLIIGLVTEAAVLSGTPQVALLTAFRSANTIARVDLRTPEIVFISSHAGSIILGSVLQGGAYIAAIFGVGYLYRATRARRPQLKRWPLPVLLTGLVLLAISTAVSGAGLVAKAHSFAHSRDHSHHAANAVLVDNALTRDATLIQFLGGLMLAIGLVLLALNAQRCGLLPKIWGVLGIISGVVYVFIFGTPLHAFPFAFWLVGLGVLLGGNWPGGVPKAWFSGEAEPWPTAAEIRAKREAEQGKSGGRGRGGRPAGRGLFAPRPAPATSEPEPAEPADGVPAGAQTAAPHPSSKKRKRKRR